MGVCGQAFLVVDWRRDLIVEDGKLGTFEVKSYVDMFKFEGLLDPHVRQQLDCSVWTDRTCELELIVREVRSSSAVAVLPLDDVDGLANGLGGQTGEQGTN